MDTNRHMDAYASSDPNANLYSIDNPNAYPRDLNTNPDARANHPHCARRGQNLLRRHQR